MNDEKALFDFKVKYTKKEYITFEKFKFQVLYKYLHIVIYFFTFFIFSVFLYKEGGIVLQNILCLIFLVLYTLFVYLFPIIITNITYSLKENKKKVGMIVSFEVYNSYLRIKVNEDENDYYFYFRKLYKVYENKSHIYLFVNRNQAYIVPKKILTGNINNFRTVLKNNLMKKYIKVI